MRPACILFDLDETLSRYDHDARVRTLAARDAATLQAALREHGLLEETIDAT